MPAQDPATVKLLTLLNVSSLKSKRRSLKSNDSPPEGQSESETPKRRKLGGKLATKTEVHKGKEQDEDEESEAESEAGDQEIESPVTTTADLHVLHFGSSQEPGPSILTPASRSAIDTCKLNTQRLNLGTGLDNLGAVVLSYPEGVELDKSEYGLPPGAEDKLLSAEPGTYPPDHVRNFAGNTDDAFRLGIRLSNKGKGWRLFSGFLNSDIIIASPLGLRMGIEREGPPDFLSSLEIMLVDQLDCLTMQNWAHLTHIIELCNVLPKEANGADFARIREYCLDGHSGYLRQTILLSAYETPQTRALFNNTQLLKNVAGRVRQMRPYGATPIPESMAIDWIKLDCDDPAKEPDARFEYFKEKIVPNILSAAQVQTLIFVPSYFDYLRVYNHLASHASTSVTGISEARQAFFKGTRPVLVITERFHFFRRYKLRAVKHITFYGPPDHAQFFTEILSFPFLDDETAPAPADVKTVCLYSKFDYMRLERLEGTKEAATMCASPAVQP
ncbi:rRNA-binding ribosome biosynthesis protein utp25 [Ceratobasidium sp. 423]|nr:rRNA-binding ribosome biosynthesis protein utp25 [Ceratobasidium sp. 423]